VTNVLQCEWKSPSESREKDFFLLVNGFKMKLIGTQRKMPVYSLAMNIFSMDINHLMTDGPQGKQ